MTMSSLQIALEPDPWAISTAIGTIAAAVAALIALILNLRTLNEMKTERELSVRPYLLFSHNSFRGRAALLWQQLEQQGMPANQRGLKVIEELQQQYLVQARNVGNGPAIGCYLYAYFPRFEPDGHVSTSYFQTDWFSLGTSTGPTDCWEGPAFKREMSWDPQTVEKLQKLWKLKVRFPDPGAYWMEREEEKLKQELGANWEETVRGEFLNYLRDNSDEIVIYRDQFEHLWARRRSGTKAILLKSKGTTLEPQQGVEP